MNRRAKSKAVDQFIEQFPAQGQDTLRDCLMAIGLKQVQTHLYTKCLVDQQVLTLQQQLNEIKRLSQQKQAVNDPQTDEQLKREPQQALQSQKAAQHSTYSLLQQPQRMDAGDLRKQPINEKGTSTYEQFTDSVMQNGDAKSVKMYTVGYPYAKTETVTNVSQPSMIRHIPDRELAYPQWWGTSVSVCKTRTHNKVLQQISVKENRTNVHLLMPSGQGVGLSNEKDAWSTPKRMIDEACQTNPAEIVRHQLAEERDRKLRLAARGQYNVRDIEGFMSDEDMDDGLVNSGWVPVSKSVQATRSTPPPNITQPRFNQVISSRSAPPKANTYIKASDKFISSVNTRYMQTQSYQSKRDIDEDEENQNEDYSTGYVMQVEEQDKDFIDIAREFAASEFVRAFPVAETTW